MVKNGSAGGFRRSEGGAGGSDAAADGRLGVDRKREEGEIINYRTDPFLNLLCQIHFRYQSPRIEGAPVKFPACRHIVR